MKHFLWATVAGTALLSAGAACANPSLLYIEVFDGATLIAGGTTGVGGGVDNAISNISEGNFTSISVSALGIPVLPSPDLSSTTINARSGTGANTADRVPTTM